MRAWAEINLDYLAHNIREVKKFLGGNVKIMAVVKAEGYGLGSVHVSEVFLQNGADALGVATCDEGFKLRKSGIKSEILIMAHSPAGMFAEIVENDLTQAVSSLKMAAELSEAAGQLGKAANIHIKIDTGMNRIGFKPTRESIDEIIEITRLPFLSVNGVYSHLAMSESSDKSFTYKQYDKFVYVTDALKQRGFTDFKTHLCNSGGVLNNTDLHLDMIRPGIILYGIYPSAETSTPLDLKPAMSLKARISHLSIVEAGESVGYDRTFYTKRKTKVATLIIGYADGYPSALSNKASVIVGSGYAPVIGQVCMDQMMIDVTDIPDVKEEDEVILYGKKGDLEIKVEQLAPLCKTKYREILCITNIGKRIPRVYIKDNKPIQTITF